MRLGMVCLVYYKRLGNGDGTRRLDIAWLAQYERLG